MPSWKSHGFVALVLILQVMVFLTVYVNVPIARIVVCFLYLLFVPGVVILKLLAMKNLDISEKILFSISLSIAFLMFIGVAINEIGKLVVSNPLSIDMLLLSINSVLLLAAFIGSTRRADSRLTAVAQTKPSRYLLLILIFVSLSLLGLFGIFNVNYSGNNLLILLLIVMVCVIVAVVFLSEKIIPPKIYPLLLLIIFFCLLLFVWSTLVTPYISGTGDTSLEYHVFRLTGQWWNSKFPSNIPYYYRTDSYYSMISITILPTIFSTITAMDSSLLFKFLYHVIAAFIALGAYKLYQTQTDNKTAFLATFFLITISIGKGMGPTKQLIAELLYVLLFLILLKRDIEPLKRSVLLIIFGTALVLSHYGQTYIFLFTILASFPILVFLHYSKTGQINILQTKIPLIFVVLFSTITFAWYIYVCDSAAFTSLVEAVETVTRNLNQFFNPESRGTALQGLTIAQTSSIYYRISNVLFLFTEFLLVIGFIKLLIGKNQDSKFGLTYKVLASLNMAIIAINILLPGLADTFLMSRFYQITLLILAPLAVTGGKAILHFVLRGRFKKVYTTVLVLLVFIPLFLFQSQFVYEVTGDQSYSLTLSGYRWNSTQLYTTTVSTQKVVGAQWIKQYANSSTNILYSDATSLSGILIAYGMTIGSNINYLLGTKTLASNVFIYVADAELVSEGYVLNATLVSPILENQNKIYSNGETEIYNGYGYVP